MLGSIVGSVYSLVCMPLAALLAIALPFLAISNGKDVIVNGYSFPGPSNGNLDAAWVLCMIFYISLRFKSTRKFYAVFPSMYQILKMLTISGLFTSVAMTAVNLAFKQASSVRRTAGSVLFIGVLVLWRVFMSVYYTRKPVVPFMEEKQEELKRAGQER